MTVMTTKVTRVAEIPVGTRKSRDGKTVVKRKNWSWEGEAHCRLAEKLGRGRRLEVGKPSQGEVSGSTETSLLCPLAFGQMILYTGKDDLPMIQLMFDLRFRQQRLILPAQLSLNAHPHANINITTRFPMEFITVRVP
jgi:hypothetical protein